MIKNISRLEQIIADKVYHFTCDSDSPLAHAKEAVLKFLQYITQVEDQVAAQKKAAEEQAVSEKASDEAKQELNLEGQA